MKLKVLNNYLWSAFEMDTIKILQRNNSNQKFIYLNNLFLISTDCVKQSLKTILFLEVNHDFSCHDNILHHTYSCPLPIYITSWQYNKHKKSNMSRGKAFLLSQTACRQAIWVQLKNNCMESEQSHRNHPDASTPMSILFFSFLFFFFSLPFFYFFFSCVPCTQIKMNANKERPSISRC